MRKQADEGHGLARERTAGPGGMPFIVFALDAEGIFTASEGEVVGAVGLAAEAGELPGSAGDSRIMERAIAASSEGVVVTDPNRPDDPIVYVNPAFEAITGYAAGEVLGRNCRFLQGEERDQPALGGLRDALRDGCECRVTLENY